MLGEAEQRDLVEHAARLEQGFVDLRDWVEETATGIDARMAAAEARIDGCVAYRSLVRYDAYGEMSGHQSSSIALLDAHRSRRRDVLDPAPRERPRLRKQMVEGESRARALAGGAAGRGHRARRGAPATAAWR